jgi:hypothetical protein
MYSAVIVHGHAGQMPGCPMSIGSHANLCMLCTAYLLQRLNTDFVGSTNTILKRCARFWCTCISIRAVTMIYAQDRLNSIIGPRAEHWGHYLHNLSLQCRHSAWSRWADARVPHANLCMLCTAYLLQRLNTDFVGSTNTINTLLFVY